MTAEKGKPFSVTAEVRQGVPFGRGRLTVSVENTVTGETHREKLTLHQGRGAWQVQSACCGCLVMQAAEKKALRGVHGPVASLIKTQEKYTVALEIALGGALQNIVVDREEDAKSAIGFLKQRDGGRATFLPLTAIHGAELREDVSGEYGFVGVASRLVQHEAQYDNVFRDLLGRTVVVEDLDSGIAMARKYRNAFRIVTLDGQVINRGGSMTGGSVSRSSALPHSRRRTASVSCKRRSMRCRWPRSSSTRRRPRC